ncbi:MAG: hypothetical protein V7K89_00935 [Nostoc sp.]
MQSAGVMIMGEINDLRFTAPPSDLERWEWFFKEMEKRGLITIFESSQHYANRGDSKLKRQYFKVKLNAQNSD